MLREELFSLEHIISRHFSQEKTRKIRQTWNKGRNSAVQSSLRTVQKDISSLLHFSEINYALFLLSSSPTFFILGFICKKKFRLTQRLLVWTADLEKNLYLLLRQDIKNKLSFFRLQSRGFDLLQPKIRLEKLFFFYKKNYLFLRLRFLIVSYSLSFELYKSSSYPWKTNEDLLGLQVTKFLSLVFPQVRN